MIGGPFRNTDKAALKGRLFYCEALFNGSTLSYVLTISFAYDGSCTAFTQCMVKAGSAEPRQKGKRGPSVLSVEDASCTAMTLSSCARHY
jgi:hypothetical protein